MDKGALSLPRSLILKELLAGAVLPPLRFFMEEIVQSDFPGRKKMRPGGRIYLRIRKEGRLCTPPGFGGIFQRRAQDNAAIDRAGLKLERVALPVLVRPSRADLVPVGLFALLRDVPGEVLRCAEGLGGVVFLRAMISSPRFGLAC
jgi:hypothetical protein